MKQGTESGSARTERQSGRETDLGGRLESAGTDSAARVTSGHGQSAAVDLSRIPEGVRGSVVEMPGVYDARRLRSQRDVIRDVMLSAADCETWLTLGELRALTKYGEASISAQLRHLRKSENGGYEVVKRHREGASPERPGADGRGECIWEYQIARGVSASRGAAQEMEAVGV
jgi:hypothetical protein